MRLKTILAGLVMLVVALGATVLAIVKSTDFNAYKDLVASQVKAATGRDLVLAGNVEVGLSLTPRVTVEQVTFRNAEWGTDPTMLRFGKLTAEVELLPLLSDQIVIRRLILSDADILLETNAADIGNWVMDSGASGGGATAPLPHIGEITLEKLSLRYRNGVTGAAQRLDIDHLVARSDGPGGAITFALKATGDNQPIQVEGTLGALSRFARGPLPLDLKGSLGALTFAVKGEIREPAALDGIALDLSLAAPMPVTIAGVTLPGAGPYRLAGNLSGEDGAFQLRGASGVVGESDFTGELAFRPGEERPYLGLRLASTKLNSKDFGLEPVLSGPDKGPSDGRAFSAEPWVIPPLDFLDADIAWTAQEFNHGPYPLKNASIELALAAGKLTLTSVTGNLVDGRFSAAGTLDSMQSPPPLLARLRADEVAAGPLLETMGLASVLTSKNANLEVELAGPAGSLRSLMAGANGHVTFEAGRGQLQNDFVRLLFADLFSLISFGGSNDASQVNCLAARFRIENGIAVSRGIVLDTPGATVLGSGQIDLGQERLALHLDTQSKQVNLANLAVPMNVGGTFTDPSVTPDALGAVGNTADFATRAADLATLGVLSSVTGLGESRDLGPDPCNTALDEGAKAAKTSPGQKIQEGAGQVIEGIGEGAKDIGEGAGKALESIGEGIGEGLNDLFGN
ncbi:MAG: AsmA family protein [Rhodospirillaceae bacterium]|nr:AsmA family protein [Rhodospirillaceae bacterium]